MMRQLFWGLAVLSATAALEATAYGADGPAIAAAPVVATRAKAAASSKLSRFFPGDSLALVLRDSSRVSGVFLDLGLVAPDEYRRRYDDWRRNSSDGATLPEIDARIELGKGRITGSGKLSFCGLGHDGVAVRRGNGPIYTVPYGRFSRLSITRGRSVESRRLQAMSSDPRTPLLTTVKIRTADDTVAVRFDDVLAVQSSAPTGSTDLRTSRFTSSSAMPRTTAAIQVGGLWANDPSDRGRVAHGAYARVSPTFATPRLGADFAVGIVHDDEGSGAGAELDLALCGTVPIGRALGVAPRAGVGLLLGGGSGFFTVTVGTGAFVRLSRGFGLRTDYTYHRLPGCVNCNYNGISSLQLGPYWGY